MAIAITVPRLGWSMDEGTFVGWLKKEGELVQAGEPLFTLEGDKASQEVEATDGGTLRLAPDGPKAGDAVSVGAVLGYLLGDNESSLPAESLPQTKAEAAGLAPAEAATAPPPAPSREQAGPEPAAAAIAISPRARRRAAELGLDYRSLKGGGRSGRIREADVLAAAGETRASGMSGMRRAIAQRTAESFAKAPHFHLRAEIDATALLEFRQRLLPGIEKACGVRLTLTDLLLRAQALALRDCAYANAIWQNDRVVRLPACDVGLVVSLEDGLLVPIVRGADAGGLEALVRQRASLVEAARSGKLAAEARQGGASSLSNLGHTCVDEFAAVLAAPQSTMLAVGRAAPRPWVVDGQLAIRTTLKLCLAVDHRVMDGAPAAQFLGRIAAALEKPDGLA